MKRLSMFVLLLVALPTAVRAQSLFSTQGLGTPLEAYDARSRALGVNGVGLAGFSASMINPAEPAGAVRRGFSATYQPWGGNTQLDGAKSTVAGTRFPLLGVIYPTRHFTWTLSYSGLLDQSWAVVDESTQIFPTDTVSIRDVERSTGGIGQLKLGAAYMLKPNFAIGAQFGLHTGSVERVVRREFPDSSLLQFETRSRWDFTGPLATVGMRWDPSAKARVGASATWSGTLKAKPKDGSTTTYEYDMPLRLTAGASGFISNRLLAAVSANISNYGSGSFTAPGTTAPTVGDRTVDLGGGLEWQEIRSGDRVFPLRAGFRMTKLPFHATGQPAPKEWTASAGMGFRLVEDDYGPIAVADIGFEKGKRTGFESTVHPDGLKENFWRVSATLSLFGR